jgi:hypothetical protein
MHRSGRVVVGTVIAITGVLSIHCGSTENTANNTANKSEPQLQNQQAQVEKVRLCHAGSDVDPHFVEIDVPRQAADAHLSEHANDFIIISDTLTPCPPPAAPSFLRICKVAGPAIVAAGTQFTFTVTGPAVAAETVTVVAGAPPTGNCTTLPFRVGTRLAVQETVTSDIVLTSIAVSPSVAGTTSLSTATANVTAVVGGTTVTFTDVRAVPLTLCKVAADPGITGTPFTFTFAGHQVTVAAGAAPTGTCASPVMVAPFTEFTITETGPVPFHIVDVKILDCPATWSFDLTSITASIHIPIPCTLVITNAAGTE